MANKLRVYKASLVASTPSSNKIRVYGASLTTTGTPVQPNKIRVYQTSLTADSGVAATHVIRVYAMSLDAGGGDWIYSANGTAIPDKGLLHLWDGTHAYNINGQSS